ncbi:hypothetical protein [Nocardiopsis kunsanensis]|uniref:hypothetical protein n=1 Tax=Nocardiopsis kunsanensis TaxID=141693 RepID=UPI001872F418|nr:hypothetical protein [Nocardiopsis kunsanensis]
MRGIVRAARRRTSSPGRALVVLDGGEPTLYLRLSSGTAAAFGAGPALSGRAAEALVAEVRERGPDTVTVDRADGGEVFGTPLVSALVAAGYHVIPEGLRLRR